MKHALIIAALLLNYTAAFAGETGTSMAGYGSNSSKPACWKSTAPNSKLEPQNFIHPAVETVTPDQQFKKRTRSNGIA